MMAGIAENPANLRQDIFDRQRLCASGATVKQRGRIGRNDAIRVEEPRVSFVEPEDG